VSAVIWDRSFHVGAAAGEQVVYPDDASAAAGAIYLADPLKLEQMLTG
jgi:hypothetical protein